MAKMRAVQVPNAKGPFQLVEREVPLPAAGAVRVRVQACGICHSDEYAKEGSRPGITYPRVPGHEIAGMIDAVGSGVLGWEVGQRVGVGWHGGHCGYCNSCRRGDFVTCSKGRQITGLTCDGGYTDFMLISAAALAPIPDEISATDAAPLLCAGITTFNSLRNSGARPGDIVAILGLGGLGHLGVQFAAKMGFETVAIARGKDKEPFAKKLGAKHYLDSESQNVSTELEKLGGARVILSTVTNGKAVNAVLGGMGINGKTILVGNPDQPLEITGPVTVALWAASSAVDTDFTAKLIDVHPNGYAQNLLDGIIRARYRESASAPRMMEAGKPYLFTIDLWAISNVFLPGHCIRLEISSSNFPRFDRNLNTGERFGEGTKGIPARQTVFHLAEMASHLLLPVIPR